MAVSIETLEEVHPEYKDLQPLWEEVDAYYRGWPTVAPYLHRHQRETDLAYGYRLTRAYYRNYIKPIVQLWVAYVFKPGVDRDPGSIEQLIDLWGNCDRKGSQMTSYMKRSTVGSNTLGDCITLVDFAKPDRKIRNKADQREQRAYPYCVKYRADQLTNWEVDELGELVWCRLKEDYPTGLGPFQDRLGRKITRYRTWDREQWWIHDVVEDGRGKKRIERPERHTGKHKLGEVPVVIHYGEMDEDEGKLRGFPPIMDMGRINRAIFSWCSILDESLHQHGIPLLTMQEEEDEDQPDEIVSGVHNVVTYAKGNNKPEFLDRPTASLEHMSNTIEVEKEEIYRMAHFGGNQFATRPTTVPSGVALAWMFSDTNQLLAYIAKQAQDTELRIKHFFAKWLGKEDDGSIKYPSKFGIDDLEAELNRVLGIQNTLRSETAKREAEKRYIRKEFAELEPDVIETMERETDDTDLSVSGQKELLDLLSGKQQTAQSPEVEEPEGAEEEEAA